MCLVGHIYSYGFCRWIFNSTMTPLEVPEMQKLHGLEHLLWEVFKLSNVSKSVNYSLKRDGYRQE